MSMKDMNEDDRIDPLVKGLPNQYPQLMMTLPELKQAHQNALDMLLEIGGSKLHLSRMLGIHVNTVYSWYNVKRMSKQGALLCEAHPRIKMSRVIFRPEILEHEWNNVDENSKG